MKPQMIVINIWFLTISSQYMMGKNQRMPTDLPKHAPDDSHSYADMKTTLSNMQNISNGSVEPLQLRNQDNWAHHHPSHSFMVHDNDTSNQMQPQQPWQIVQQQFDKEFWDIQQQIQEQYSHSRIKSSTSWRFSNNDKTTFHRMSPPRLNKTPRSMWYTRIQQSSNIFLQSTAVPHYLKPLGTNVFDNRTCRR